MSLPAPLTSPALNAYGITTAPHTTNGRTYSAAAPTNSTGYVATGKSHSVPYEGSYDELVTLADGIITQATQLAHISIQITESPGGIAKMTVTTTYYTPDDTDPSSSGDTAADVGKSRENPQYSFEFADQELSVLLHPLFQQYKDDLTDAQQAAVEAWAAGADRSSFILDVDLGYRVPIKIALEHAPQEIKDYVLGSNPRRFIYTFVTAKATYEMSPTQAIRAAADVMKIKDPPGYLKDVPRPAGANWLFAAIAYQSGAKCTCTETYKLSAPGGWPKEIYGGKS